MFYLVATPIGHLGDITLRAIEILKSCDYILCEDTRHSLSLLKHYDIHIPLKSYHKFNEASRESLILADLKAGQTIALISDAGTPGISDPGARIVQRCVEEAIAVVPIPGPCAAITALVASGLSTDRFQFFGFLPRKPSEFRTAIQEILGYPGTTICYESPQRLKNALKVLAEEAPTRLVVVARELTKKFEEFVRGTPAELLAHYEEHTLKGEIVLLISCATKDENDSQWEQWTPAEHVAHLSETLGLAKGEAIKLAAQQRKVPKRVIYNSLLK